MRSIIPVAALLAFCATGPAFAETLNADSARAFVVGRTFSFNCFEGSSGAGRVNADGSVAGTINLRAQGPTRFVRLPANTLRVRGESVCGYMKGMSFEPCFDLEKTGPNTFRGTLAGVKTMWCEFARAGSDRTQMTARRSRSKVAEEE